MIRTRVPFLGLERVDKDCWRFFDLEDASRPAAVGLCYKTKAEALADLHRYASENWGWIE